MSDRDAPSAPNCCPTRLGHYRILERLGGGGMGEVYVAEDMKLRRQVALKTLPLEMSSSADRRERFKREAQALAAVNHPNIVTLYSVEEDKGIHFITMELVEGRTLQEVLDSSGPLPLEQLLDVAVQAAEGLAEAHSRNIVHCDLKLQNVMVTPEGRVKLLDFGLARVLGWAQPAQRGDPLTSNAVTVSVDPSSAGKLVGTVAYMSPEQCWGTTWTGARTSSPSVLCSTSWPQAEGRSRERRWPPRWRRSCERSRSLWPS